MTTAQPQTIVIRTIPTKNSTTLTVTQRENDMLEDLYGDGGGPRKRRRLTHLSQDEKMMRRKLKNRVAAQTARDRKKTVMTDLEEKLALLEHENQKLAQENANLKAKTGNLSLENTVLKERLNAVGESPVKIETGFGSAVSTDLLPQGQTLPVYYWARTSAASMMMLSMTLLLASSRQTSDKSEKPSPTLKRKRSPVQDCQTTQHNPLTKWWGPHQQSWSPSMN